MLEAPARSRALTSDLHGSRAAFSPRREPVADLQDDSAGRRAERQGLEDDDAVEKAQQRRRLASGRGLRLRLGGRVPRSLAGKVAAVAAVLGGLCVFVAVFLLARSALLQDARLTIPSSNAIAITGNDHLSRAQLISVFGEDVDRNVLAVPLDARRAELESLPWVEHATVMRLLPNHLRVAITERHPVAFVRQGGEIGLVDAHGVLLNLTSNSNTAQDPAHSYSFPVLSGISATEPASVRAARMKLFAHFMEELDAGSEKISRRLSEVDLTDPEDVKALISDNGASVLVHFGDDEFLPRYQRYVQNLPEWKTRYPKLASVDMRYEHEVVLEMQPGALIPVPGEGESVVAPAKLAGARPAVKKPGVKRADVKKADGKKAHARPIPPASVRSMPGHLQQAFDVHPKTDSSAASAQRKGPQ